MGVFLTNNIIEYLSPIKEIRWKLFLFMQLQLFTRQGHK